jgi:hypothetical protein
MGLVRRIETVEARSWDADQEAGEDVHVQASELARELLPAVGLKSGFDRSGPRCFRIVGEGLVPEDYERVSSDGRGVQVYEDGAHK